MSFRRIALALAVASLMGVLAPSASASRARCLRVTTWPGAGAWGTTGAVSTAS